MIIETTKELDHEIEDGKRKGSHDKSWRVMSRFFTKSKNGSGSGVLNLAAAWFMQGKEVR